MTAAVVTAGQVNKPADALQTQFITITATGEVHGTHWFFSPPVDAIRRGRKTGKQTWYLTSNVGYTLYRKDGVWVQGHSPETWEYEGATDLFIGGRTYPVDLAKKTELEAAGYASGISSAPF
jgi:hypothetical protein